MLELLPDSVLEIIQTHLREGSIRGEQGWSAGLDEEDTLTGDFLSSLRTNRTSYRVDGETWEWGIKYKKFRSKGKGAEELILGADGIVQIEIRNLVDGKMQSKGLLFQAKKKGDGRSKKLREQCRRMESIAKNGSAIFEYGPKGYTAISSNEITKSAETTLSKARGESIGAFLADKFLKCTVGTTGLYFDAVRQILVVPDKTQGVVERAAELGHRLKIEVSQIV